MKLNAELVIDANRDTVWAALADYRRRPRWQQHLVDVQPVSGRPGEIGSAVKLGFAGGGEARTAIESMTEGRRPEFLAFIIENDVSRSLVVHTLERLDDGHTRWKVWSNTRFNGLAKFRALFKTDDIRKRLDDDMQRFKLMLESDESEKHS